MTHRKLIVLLLALAAAQPAVRRMRAQGAGGLHLRRVRRVRLEQRHRRAGSERRMRPRDGGKRLHGLLAPAFAFHAQAKVGILHLPRLRDGAPIAGRDVFVAP